MAFAFSYKQKDSCKTSLSGQASGIVRSNSCLKWSPPKLLVTKYEITPEIMFREYLKGSVFWLKYLSLDEVFVNADGCLIMFEMHSWDDNHIN